MVEFICL